MPRVRGRKSDANVFRLLLFFSSWAALQPANAEQRLQCLLDDGSRFDFVGRRWSAEAKDMGPHEVVGVGRNPDGFAYAYTITYRREGRETTLDFNDDEPQCENYGIAADGTVFALTDRAHLRTRTANGKIGGSMLVVSVDGGRSFGGNLHPNAPERFSVDFGGPTIGNWPTSYRSRFDIRGASYRLETTDPATFESFRLRLSVNRGASWQQALVSSEPSVFSGQEVMRWREQFALVAWSNFAYKRWSEACRLHPGPGCAVEINARMDTLWSSCRTRDTARNCLPLVKSQVTSENLK